MELGIHDSYEETVTASAGHFIDGPVEITIDGLVNVDVAGTYEIKYTATDMAGNASTVTRTVDVVDYIAMDYDVIAGELRALGLENNLDEVTTDNYQNFGGLYFEKSAIVDGVMTKIGRVTFKGMFDLSDSYLIDFIYQLADRMHADLVGEIGIDFREVSDLVPVFGRGATIKFYNLDKLDYRNDSTADEVYSKISVFNDDGYIINKSSLVPKSGVYVGCSGNKIECFTFTIDVKHFSQYKIGKAPVKVKVDKPDKPVEKTPDVVVVVNKPPTTAGNFVQPIINIGTQETLGVSTVKPADKTTTQIKPVDDQQPAKSGWNNLFGVMWYWWALIGIVMLLVWWIFIG